jgi:hypothetical protein
MDEQILSLTGVGLGKSVEEQIGIEAGGEGPDNGGERKTSVAEQIAAATAIGQASSKSQEKSQEKE